MEPWFSTRMSGVPADDIEEPGSDLVGQFIERAGELRLDLVAGDQASDGGLEEQGLPGGGVLRRPARATWAASHGCRLVCRPHPLGLPEGPPAVGDLRPVSGWRRALHRLALFVRHDDRHSRRAGVNLGTQDPATHLAVFSGIGR
jgi:hypothetical protein